MKIIAKIHTDMPEKFGLPRQSGVVPELTGRIVFEPEYKNPDALRGLEGFSHIWVIWRFDGFDGGKWSPTVRPPRLGGNKRVGVFATRSPNRPNPVGLSCLKLEKIEDTDLYVSGIDMKDGTGVYDIKPYLKLTDCRPEATAGFAEDTAGKKCRVVFSGDVSCVESGDLDIIRELLEEDPRPSYINDPDRVYGMKYKDYNVRFTASDGVINVTEAKKEENERRKK